MWNKNIIINKHWILLVFYLIRFVCIILLALFLSFLGYFYFDEIGKEIVLYIIYPVVFLLINYSFFRLIFALIEYYHYLFIISWEQIFVINATFLLRDDIEVIESFKINKLDVFCRGFFANIFTFGKMMIELQTKEVRVFRFMPKPYEILHHLQKQRDIVLENRQKKYIIDKNISHLDDKK